MKNELFSTIPTPVHLDHLGKNCPGDWQWPDFQLLIRCGGCDIEFSSHPVDKLLHGQFLVPAISRLTKSLVCTQIASAEERVRIWNGFDQSGNALNTTLSELLSLVLSFLSRIELSIVSIFTKLIQIGWCSLLLWGKKTRYGSHVTCIACVLEWIDSYGWIQLTQSAVDVDMNCRGVE